MDLRTKRRVRLLVEHLEDRCVPAYLTTFPQAFRVGAISNTGVDNTFQLRAAITASSAPYIAPGGQRQVVTSMPIQAIQQPTQAEWNLLQARFANNAQRDWQLSQNMLGDNSLIVRSAEAMGPDRQVPGTPVAGRAVAQSLFVQYNRLPAGNPPLPIRIHWLQFVTTNTLPVATGGTAGMNPTPGIDNDGNPNSPLYDQNGFAQAPGFGTGFVDNVVRLVQQPLTTWQADLFLVQDTPNVGGGVTEVIWQGIRWGWQTAVAPNQAPQGNASSVTTLENTAYVFAPSDFGFTDPLDDSVANNFQAAKITTLPGAGTLTINGAAVNAGDYVSVSDIDSGLLVFTPSSNTTGAPYDNFTFQVQDDGGTDDGGVDTDPIPRTMTINVMSSSFVNHAPIGADNTVTTLENTDYVFGAADFGFTDPNDSPANNLRAIQITSLPSGGTLSDNGIALSAGDLVSLDHLNDGLLAYTPAANSGGTSYDSFAFKVQDDGGTYNSGTDTDSTARAMTISVTLVNQAPAGTDNMLITLENTPYTFSAFDFGFTDPDDSPADNFTAVKIANLPYFGTLTNNGIAVSEGDYISVSDINAGYLVFTPASNVSGTPSDGFLFQVQDDGGTADGGVDTDPWPKLMTFNVNWVNQAPSGTSNTVSTPINTPYTFTAADFGFSDPNDSPANNFYRVKIVTLPGAGTLTNNGVALSPGDFVTVSDINSGLLVFTPAAYAHGTAYSSFTFAVQDDGGTANGGVDLDATPNTMTINVTSDVVISWATITTNGYIAGAMWNNEPLYSNQPVTWAFGISAGPGDDPLQGFGVSLTSNGDGTFNVGPYVNEYVVYWGPPQTNNIEADYDPETFTYHLQLTFLDLDDNEVTIDIYCG